MDTQDIVSEISELNLTYLMLAQQMLVRIAMPPFFVSASRKNWLTSC